MLTFDHTNEDQVRPIQHLLWGHFFNVKLKAVRAPGQENRSEQQSDPHGF